jgi:hypothetical protein
MVEVNEPSGDGVFWSANGDGYFFVGDYTRIWMLNEAQDIFDDVTKASATYEASKLVPWQFVQYGDRVTAVSKNQTTQYFDLGDSTTFDDLAGSPPKARCGAQVRDFVMVGSTTEAGTSFNTRVRWCGFDDTEDWTTDPGGTQADFQDMDAAYGEVIGIVGGEFATVFQQRAISRFTYAGPPFIFQRDTVEINRGAIATLSIVPVGRLIFYYSQEGFFAFDGASSTPVSQNMNRWIKNKITDDTAQRMRSAHYPDIRCIMWSWPYDPTGADRPTSSLRIIFNYDVGRWTWDYSATARWYWTVAPSETLYIDDPVYGELLIDDLDDPIDSQDGRQTRVVAWNYDGVDWSLKELDGGDVEARLETVKLDLSPGRRTMITSARVIGNLTSATTMRVAAQSSAAYPANTLASDSGVADFGQNAFEDGFVPLMAEGRYHGIMTKWDGGIGTTTGDLEELTVVQGIEIEWTPLGKF